MMILKNSCCHFIEMWTLYHYVCRIYWWIACLKWIWCRLMFIYFWNRFIFDIPTVYYDFVSDFFRHQFSKSKIDHCKNLSKHQLDLILTSCSFKDSTNAIFSFFIWKLTEVLTNEVRLNLMKLINHRWKLEELWFFKIMWFLKDEKFIKHPVYFLVSHFYKP